VSEKLRIGNVYKHPEHGEIVVTNRDHENNVYYRKVKHRDNAGVVSASQWERSTSYDDLLGSVRMRDYPSGDGDENAPRGDDVPNEWSALASVIKERDNHTCQGCGVRGHRYQEDSNSSKSSACGAQDTELAAHHIVPLGCGGTNTLRNLITLCSECHGRVHGGKI
jgi:hypothetical protein